MFGILIGQQSSLFSSFLLNGFGSVFEIWIRNYKVNECVSKLDPDSQHCYSVPIYRTFYISFLGFQTNNDSWTEGQSFTNPDPAGSAQIWKIWISKESMSDRFSKKTISGKQKVVC